MGASFHGMPMSQAMGEQRVPRALPRECGNGMCPWAQRRFDDAEHDGVDEADDSEEADEHDGDVEGELAAVDGAAGDGADEVFVLVLFVFLHVNGAHGFGDFGFGDEHFGDEDGAGRGHDDGGEEVLRADAEEDVGRHDAAGDVRHAGGHDGHEFGAGGVAEERADGERGFGLAHEDAGGDVRRFGAACAHRPLHDPGDDLDDLLHDAEVIEHREKRGDEDDGGQDGEGEGGERVAGGAETAEDHGGAVDGVGEEAGDGVGTDFEDFLAVAPLDDEDGEEELEAETPGDGAPLDGFAIGGECVGDAEKNEKS